MIKAKIINEVVGTPKEHVDKTLKLLLDKVKSRKDLKIENEKSFEAKQVEGKPFFSAFVEYELSTENLISFMGFCFDFLPSSIEILEPTELKMDSKSGSELFNEIMARLHQNDRLLRNTLAQYNLLKSKLGQE